MMRFEMKTYFRLTNMPTCQLRLYSKAIACFVLTLCVCVSLASLSVGLFPAISWSLECHDTLPLTIANIPCAPWQQQILELFWMLRIVQFHLLFVSRVKAVFLFIVGKFRLRCYVRPSAFRLMLDLAVVTASKLNNQSGGLCLFKESKETRSF